MSGGGAYVGEIRMYGGDVPPLGWLVCDGRILDILSYQDLFNVIGATFGGNGTTTFGIPDLRAKVPIHWGSGPGLTPRTFGEVGGEEATTLIEANLPPHNHDFGMVITDVFTQSTTPDGNKIWKTSTTRDHKFGSIANGTLSVLPPQFQSSGVNPALTDNIQPFTTINYIISTFGFQPPIAV